MLYREEPPLLTLPSYIMIAKISVYVSRCYIFILVGAFGLVVGEVEVQGDSLLEDRVSMLMIDQPGLYFILICVRERLRRFHCTLV